MLLTILVEQRYIRTEKLICIQYNLVTLTFASPLGNIRCKYGQQKPRLKIFPKTHNTFAKILSNLFAFFVEGMRRAQASVWRFLTLRFKSFTITYNLSKLTNYSAPYQ